MDPLRAAGWLGDRAERAAQILRAARLFPARDHLGPVRLSHVARAQGRRIGRRRADPIGARRPTQGDTGHQELLALRLDAGHQRRRAQFDRAGGEGRGLLVAEPDPAARARFPDRLQRHAALEPARWRAAGGGRERGRHAEPRQGAMVFPVAPGTGRIDHDSDRRRQDQRRADPDGRFPARPLLASLLARHFLARDAAYALTMEPRPQDFERADYAWMVIGSVVFFLLVAIAAWRAFHAEWQPIQRQFRTILERHDQVEAARRFDLGIRQIWNPEIGVVDRCVTCHLGYEWGSRLPADLPQPFAPHPALPYLDQHPFTSFGCTVCHGGQGWATQSAAAHTGGEHWDDPMLSKALALRYGLEQSQLIQMRCNYCHRHDLSTPGMDEINAAKVLFKKKKCLVCHVVEGRGGLTAPELTYFGDKN